VNKIVSFFGERSLIFEELNRQAEHYAAGLGLAYQWLPQTPYDQKAVIAALQTAQCGIIDVEPYGAEIFREVRSSTRLFVRFGVGYDKVDLPAASLYGIAIARTTGANTLGVAEMALTLILATRRKLKINQHCLENGQWAKNVASEISGSVVGIVGFGAIGQALTELLAGFHCHMIAYDPFPNHAKMAAQGVELVSLENLFKIADVISLHAPITADNVHMVGPRLLSLMKPTAIIVNTARGQLIDEMALCEVLSAGRIGGAGLDVYEQEPLPLSSPLLKLENVMLTPHVSSQTRQSLWRIYQMAIDIANDFFNGRDSLHILNPDYKNRVL
jgi:D-3-phosphoglycerate dehydrogenase / 2-oxoglutarate reductase